MSRFSAETNQSMKENVFKRNKERKQITFEKIENFINQYIKAKRAEIERRYWKIIMIYGEEQI